MIHVGKMIQDALQKSTVKKSDLAKRLGITHQTVNNLCRRKSVNVMLLQRISVEIEYDLVSEYVAVLKSCEDFPVLDRGSEEYRELLNLKYECERLNCENQYLKMLISLAENQETANKGDKENEKLQYRNDFAANEFT